MATDSPKDMDSKSVQHIKWKQLYRRPEQLSLPFRLEPEGSQDMVLCKKILRLVPRKRITFLGEWQGRPVVIKLFIEPGRAATHYARELAGIHALIETATPTPALLYSGRTQRYRIPVLITEYLASAQDLTAAWQACPTIKQITPLMKAVTLELATQHVQGILQRDLHFGNLLIKNKKIYSLDGSSIDFFGGPLPRRDSLAHLALFFSQLPAGTSELQQQLLKVYTTARAWRLKKTDLKFLQKTTRQLFDNRLHQLQKKIMRTNSRSKFTARFGTRIWYSTAHESPALLQLLQNPDAVFAADATVTLKKGRSATVISTTIAGQPLVIKRYNIKNAMHWLRRALRPTRAVHSWQHAHLLQLAGIATGQPVACIEKHFLGLRGRSYFIMEHTAGENLSDCFARFTTEDPRFAQIVGRISELLTQLQEAGLSHGDLKATNIILQNDKPMLIDLDGMKKRRDISVDRQRFMKNWVNRPEIAALFTPFGHHVSL